MIRWTPIEEIPPVNIKDDFCNRNNISERLLVYLETHHTAFAIYYHDAKAWSVEGYRGDFKVTHWSYINKPD